VNYWMTRGGAVVAGAIAAAGIYAGCDGSTAQSPPGNGADAAVAGGDAAPDAGDATMGGGDAGEPGDADANRGDGTLGSSDAAEGGDSGAGDGPPVDASNSSPESASDVAVGGDASEDASDAPADATSPDGATFDAADAAEAGPLCSADANACTGTLACCSGACIDTRLDPNNCGACGNACGSSSFCTGTSCVQAVIANLCDNPRATLVFDPYTVDNQATLAAGGALMATCMLDGGVAQVTESDAGDGPSWRPSTGVGDTYVAFGGSYGQHGVAYLDENGLTSLYLVGDGTTGWFNNRRNLTTVVTAAGSSLSAHHDYFFLQVTVEPTTGTLSLMGVGMLGPGTAAAGYYASAVVLPAYSSYPDSWYAYEWTDTNGDSIANAGDTFTLIAHGR
jgi:hypothetical protein